MSRRSATTVSVLVASLGLEALLVARSVRVEYGLTAIHTAKVDPRFADIRIVHTGLQAQLQPQ